MLWNTTRQQDNTRSDGYQHAHDYKANQVSHPYFKGACFSKWKPWACTASHITIHLRHAKDRKNYSRKKIYRANDVIVYGRHFMVRKYHSPAHFGTYGFLAILVAEYAPDGSSSRLASAPPTTVAISFELAIPIERLFLAELGRLSTASPQQSLTDPSRTFVISISMAGRVRYTSLSMRPGSPLPRERLCDHVERALEGYGPGVMFGQGFRPLWATVSRGEVLHVT